VMLLRACLVIERTKWLNKKQAVNAKSNRRRGCCRPRHDVKKTLHIFRCCTGQKYAKRKLPCKSDDRKPKSSDRDRKVMTGTPKAMTGSYCTEWKKC
jgi:hypothetical protein